MIPYAGKTHDSAYALLLKLYNAAYDVVRNSMMPYMRQSINCVMPYGKSERKCSLLHKRNSKRTFASKLRHTEMTQLIVLNNHDKMTFELLISHQYQINIPLNGENIQH